MAQQPGRDTGQPVVPPTVAHAHNTRMDLFSCGRHRLQVAAAVLALLTVASCGGDTSHGGAAAIPASRAMSSSSWLTNSSQQADVLATVRAYWRAYLAVTRAPFDATAAEATATRVATGPAAAALVDVAGNDAIAGLAVRGAVISHPRVRALSESNASVVDCVDDRTGAFRDDGTRVDVDDPRPHQVVLSLVRGAVGWRVTAVDQSEESCVLG
jgi:hypothetical protein